jgi:hypothetical protein
VISLIVVKYIFSFIVFPLVLFLSNFSTVRASLIIVRPDGEVRVNVLGSSVGPEIPDHSSFSVSKIADSASNQTNVITLKKNDDKVNLEVIDSGQVKTMDVTNWKDSVVEVEERPLSQKIEITVADGEFSLKNKDVTASTSEQLSIDPTTGEISVGTKTGNKYLSVFPYDAVQSLLRTKIVSRITSMPIKISDGDKGLQYKIDGEKVISILNLYEYKIPISSYVSASTGEIIKLDLPAWLSAINFLFS